MTLCSCFNVPATLKHFNVTYLWNTEEKYVFIYHLVISISQTQVSCLLNNYCYHLPVMMCYWSVSLKLLLSVTVIMYTLLTAVRGILAGQNWYLKCHLCRPQKIHQVQSAYTITCQKTAWDGFTIIFPCDWPANSVMMRWHVNTWYRFEGIFCNAVYFATSICFGQCNGLLRTEGPSHLVSCVCSLVALEGHWSVCCLVSLSVLYNVGKRNFQLECSACVRKSSRP